MKQHEAVILTLEELGGVATLGQLYQEVFKITDCEWKTKTKFASIRRIVQTRKEIYKVQCGLYVLVKCKKQLENSGVVQMTDANKNSNDVQQFTHGHYQGMLLALGKLRGFQTFAPAQDKNRLFGVQKLGSIQTMSKLPEFGYSRFVKRSSTIDAIWFNSRSMPDSFFEVEHSTDIQNSLIKYLDLFDFHTRMYIVADSSRKKSFEDKLSRVAFEQLKKDGGRVKFLSYEELEKRYNAALEMSSLETAL